MNTALSAIIVTLVLMIAFVITASSTVAFGQPQLQKIGTGGETHISQALPLASR